MGDRSIYRSLLFDNVELAFVQPHAYRNALAAITAVGLVSLPGMMTGQILFGVAPLVAAKYQIVVMTMLFGASGISAAMYLVLANRSLNILSNEAAPIQ